MTVGPLFFSVIAGAIVGIGTGLVGGAVGGGIDGYMGPLARLVSSQDRVRFARDVAFSGMRGSAIVGLVFGGVTGTIGGLVEPPILLLAAAVLAFVVARQFVRAVGESIEGIVGRFIGAAVLGVIGGYVGRIVAALVLNRL